MPLRAGVIGVGSMGQNHARVYRDLPEAELWGVFDADTEQARPVAETYGTAVRPMDELLDIVDLVSVAVPTEYHYDTVRECIDAGVDVLVEKPFTATPEEGRKLIQFAEERDVTLQVGHIERFNPAMQKVMELVEPLDVIAVDCKRLGPPIDRELDDSVVMDLMIHDVDLLTRLVDGRIAGIDAIGNTDVQYAAANVQFESGVVAQLTASRVTQEKERRLSISAESCRVKADFIDQTIEIHRQSLPEYVQENGDVTYHHENVVEQVSVENREPLKEELSAFIDAVSNGDEPVVTAKDGLRALDLTRTIDDLARERTPVSAPEITI